MKSFNILIPTRKSIGGYESRAIQERLIEPFDYLKRNFQLNYFVIPEEECDSLELQEFTHMALNRPYSSYALNAILKAKQNKITVIIDLDDIPTLRDSNQRSRLNIDQKQNFTQCIKEANYLTCSTHRLHKWLKENFENKHTTLIQTGFNFDRIEACTKSPILFQPNSILFTNAGSLKLGEFSMEWMQGMEYVLRKHNWKLDVYADFIDYFPETFPLNYKGSMPWFEHKTTINKAYPFAVTPLMAEEEYEGNSVYYTQFKTPTKYIGYGGLGIPGIYSESKIYEDVITNGVNGILVKNNIDAWVNAVEMLIDSPDLRKKIKINAQKDVLEKYEIKETSTIWKNLLIL